MGTPAPPSPVSPSSAYLHSPLDDWFATSNCDHLSVSAFPQDGSLSSAGGSSSSSSSSSDRPQLKSALHSNGLDGPLHLRGHAAFSPIGSPNISSDSASKEKPGSPSGCVSAVSKYSMLNSNAMESSAPQRFQAFHGVSSHLGNAILKPLEENTSSCIGSILTSVSASASAALSSPASIGAAVTKVSKRRPRVNKKAPIAVLSADPSNFRAMVQQLTGIPPSHVSPPIWGSSGAPLLRPQPTRFPYNGGLPTLDTSASFLGPGQSFPFWQRAQQPLMNGLLSGDNAAEHTGSQSRGNMANYDALPSVADLWNTTGHGAPSGNRMKGNSQEISVANLVRECEQSFPRQASSFFESLLMSEDDTHRKLPIDAVDTWLAAFDGGALVNQSPRVDLAKIAS